jgi:hypothetical protein
MHPWKRGRVRGFSTSPDTIPDAGTHRAVQVLGYYVHFLSERFRPQPVHPWQCGRLRCTSTDPDANPDAHTTDA